MIFRKKISGSITGRRERRWRRRRLQQIQKLIEKNLNRGEKNHAK